ncbi:hypothetical protein B0H19DRAFT_1133765 [Mycena capillaripes]|nr:hypothetical protein B0H19DRAFT_1133765 [Mycena capillaripes]
MQFFFSCRKLRKALMSSKPLESSSHQTVTGPFASSTCRQIPNPAYSPRGWRPRWCTISRRTDALASPVVFETHSRERSWRDSSRGAR